MVSVRARDSRFLAGGRGRLSQTTGTVSTPHQADPAMPGPRLGGLARARSLTSERRSVISRNAALVRHDTARHRTCPVPRLQAVESDADTELRLPVFAVDGLGVPRDLLRWMLVQDDSATPEFSRGDVLVLALAPPPRPDAVHAVVADGKVLLGRLSVDGGRRMFTRLGAGPDGGDVPGDVVGHVVARLGVL